MSTCHSRRDFLKWTSSAVAAMHLPFLSRTASAQQPTVWEKKVHLQHLRLRSNRIPEQAKYYRDVLRVPVEQSGSESLRVTLGSSTLEFVSDADYERPFYHVAFTIPENQLDNAIAWLEPRCPIIPLSPRGDKIMNFRHWNAHSIFFYDPAGNILEFIAHHDLENKAASAFDESQIAYISEIGVVVPEVRDFEGEMKGRFGLSPYRNTSPVFSAIGDIGGLLITVKKGRTWLPYNGVGSEVFPTDVTLSGMEAPGTYRAEGLPYTITHT